MIDPFDLTWIEFLQILHRYIDNIGQSGRLLPIVATVYLLFESSSLVQFWIDKEHPLYHQEVPEELRQIWFSEHR